MNQRAVTLWGPPVQRGIRLRTVFHDTSHRWREPASYTLEKLAAFELSSGRVPIGDHLGRMATEAEACCSSRMLGPDLQLMPKCCDPVSVVARTRQT